MEQTAVEWLEVQIKNTPTVKNLMNQLDAFIKEAKEIEKQQIIDAWMAEDNELQRLAAEQYYNEKFKKK